MAVLGILADIATVIGVIGSFLYFSYKVWTPRKVQEGDDDK